MCRVLNSVCPACADVLSGMLALDFNMLPPRMDLPAYRNMTTQSALSCATFANTSEWRFKAALAVASNPNGVTSA